MTVTEYFYAVFEPAITFFQGLDYFSIGINVIVFVIIFGSFAFMLKP